MGKKSVFVVAELPNAGLANCLFVWARAAIYAHEHKLPMLTIGWNRIHLGPLLRGERVKRYYRGYFKDQMSVTKEFILRKKIQKSSVQFNPDITTPAGNFSYIVFNELPHWSDYFTHLKKHRGLVKELLLANLTPSLASEYNSLVGAEVSFHVRMGDFRELSPDEDFSKVGLVRTPMNYFKSVWNNLKNLGYQQANLFSDGNKEELSELLELKGIQWIHKQKDILDLLQMSKSSVIVTSASSSFSLWSGFLSDAILVLHPDHIHAPLREESHLVEVSANEINSLKPVFGE